MRYLPIKRHRVCPALIEFLEPRTLLSVSIASYFQPALISLPHIAKAAVATTTGITLHLTAGTPFSGQLAFYPSPVLDPPLGYSATISWGDGSTSSAKLQYATQLNAGGYAIDGNHTYSKAGTYKIKVTLIQGPINPLMGLPSRIVAKYIDKAIVSPAPPPTTGGVTINEIAGQSFTTSLGSFITIAPGTNLQASIDWGDNSTSQGTLQPAGVTGIDTLAFNVLGTHTYATAGTYSIQVTVARSFPGPGGGPSPQVLLLIASFKSTAIVTSQVGTPISLAGTLTGTYLLAPVATPIAVTPVADGGGIYVFQGSGKAGDLGQVTVSGTIHTVGFIVTGQAEGMLTLTNANGSVTLTVTGPPQPDFSPFPTTLSYTISGATGLYAGDTASGSIAATLTPSPTAIGKDMFTFLLS